MKKTYGTAGGYLADGDAVALVAAARLGDAGAMDALLAAFDGLLRYISRRYPLHGGYEDAWQEARLGFLIAIHRFDATVGAPFAAFANQFVRGFVRTAMRREWRYEDAVDWGGAAGELTAPEAATGDEMACVVDAIALETLLDDAKLSARERTYVLNLVRGLTPMEMARDLGVSVETVRTWRKRAVAKVRQVMERE